MQHFPVLVLVSSQYNFEILREKEQQSKDKSAENESSGSVNIQGIDLKQMFQWCLKLYVFLFQILLR